MPLQAEAEVVDAPSRSASSTSATARRGPRGVTPTRRPSPVRAVPQEEELEEQVEVVETRAIADEEEAAAERKAERMRKRRMKLAAYMTEELAKTYGDHQEQYKQDMDAALSNMGEKMRETYFNEKAKTPSLAQKRLVQETKVPKVLGPTKEAPAYSGWAQVEYTEKMVMVGEVGPARQAWCRWWDRTTGCGELVDLDDEKEIAVVSAALQTGANVFPKMKYLRHGEFVEYRRVDRGEGGSPRALLVRGIKGWPLMCEVGAPPNDDKLLGGAGKAAALPAGESEAAARARVAVLAAQASAKASAQASRQVSRSSRSAGTAVRRATAKPEAAMRSEQSRGARSVSPRGGAAVEAKVRRARAQQHQRPPPAAASSAQERRQRLVQAQVAGGGRRPSGA